MKPPSTLSPALPGSENAMTDAPGGLRRGLPMRAGRVFFFLKRYWWIPTLTLLAGVAGAGAYVHWTPPSYISTAAMWETEKLHLSEGALFTDDPQTYIGTQIELLKSQHMWQAATERLRLSGTNAVPLGPDGLPLEIKLGFKEAPKSAVFAITATSPDGNYCRNFLDSLMSEYLSYKKDVRKLVSGETAASISAQVESQERELKSAQEALTSFQRTNNLAVLQEEGSVAGDYLARLQTELSDLQLESQLLAATAVEQDGPQPPGRNPLELMKSAEAPGNQPQNQDQRLTPYEELEMLKIQREKLSEDLRPKHPKIASLDAEISRGEKLVEILRSQSHGQLEASKNAIVMKINSVASSIKVWEAKVVDANSRIAEAERLKLDVTRAQSVFDRLETLLQNIDITRNTDMETLAILEPASLAKLSWKTTITACALAVLAGLGSGVVLVVLLERRDDRFTSLRDIHVAVGDAVIGAAPQVSVKKKQRAGLLQADDPRHEYAQAYRRLRSALYFLPGAGARPKVILVTSAIPGEGKTSVAANLARTLALAGSRTLLVDGDLRRGCLHELTGLKDQPGLTEVLRGLHKPDDAVQQDAWPQLSFVACGARVSNPGDLFPGQRLDLALARWRNLFDYVIIDSSPLFAADDACSVAPKVDGVLLVARRGHSPTGAVMESLDLLAQRQAVLLGIVFNGADATTGDYQYDKHHEYSVAVKAA